MAELERLKKDFAELVVKAGVNLQKGQRLVLRSPVECADFARLCAAAAYEAGCREVITHWEDDGLKRMKFLHAADEVFDTVDSWEVDFFDSLSAEGAAFLTIYTEDPECLKDVDPDRIKRATISSGKALESYRKRMMRSESQWCICSVPAKAWACQIFPQLSEEKAIARLWEEILASCRVDGGDAIQNWGKHSNELKKHVDIMNDYNFKTLKYKNSAGTDLTIDLPEGHIWAGGNEMTTKGLPFSANIPTEEVFTMPDKNSANGTVVATRPLCLNGTLIEGLRFEVKNGKIIEAHADAGEDVLRDAIAVDEGASHFGEVALVPYDSPISKSNVIFFNTLFDENAACHIAFGEAYPSCIAGGETMNEEELEARGVNKSMMHEDFMIGSADLEITGITHDGKEVPVFREGNFVF